MNNFMIVQVQDGQSRIIGAEGNIASVTSDGKLNISQNIVTPEGKTPFIAGGSVLLVPKNGGSITETNIIPNGETLTLTDITFGGMAIAQTSNPLQAKFSVWYQPNGNTVNQELIDIIYLQGISEGFKSLDSNFVGDGIARIFSEVVNQGKDNIECTRFCRGYY